MHLTCIFFGADDANVTLFWIKSSCLWLFLSIYCLACCINKKLWSLITCMKMNLKLLLFYTSSNGNTTLEWTTKTDQVSHSTYSMWSNRKEFLFISRTLAFHSTENWSIFTELSQRGLEALWQWKTTDPTLIFTGDLSSQGYWTGLELLMLLWTRKMWSREMLTYSDFKI